MTNKSKTSRRHISMTVEFDVYGDDDQQAGVRVALAQASGVVAAAVLDHADVVVDGTLSRSVTVEDVDRFPYLQP